MAGETETGTVKGTGTAEIGTVMTAETGTEIEIGRAEIIEKTERGGNALILRSLWMRYAL